MNKDGTGQIDAVAMCYTSAGAPATLPDGHPLVPFFGLEVPRAEPVQHIDWTTIEIKAVVEWKIGDSLVLEYSADAGFYGRRPDRRTILRRTHFPLEGGE